MVMSGCQPLKFSEPSRIGWAALIAPDSAARNEGVKEQIVVQPVLRIEDPGDRVECLRLAAGVEKRLAVPVPNGGLLLCECVLIGVELIPAEDRAFLYFVAIAPGRR